MEILQVQYHLEVYEESFINDPSWSMRTSTPISTVSVGDYFNDRAFDRWHNSLKQGEKFKVVEVEHILWEIEGSHIGHKVMLLLKAVPYENT